MRPILIALLLTLVGSFFLITTLGYSADFQVYSVIRGLSMGDPNEIIQKDFYVNMGATEGVKEGSLLEVMRRVPTYSQTSEQLYQDVMFPIARIKVIHTEAKASIARLEKMLPVDKTPAISPHAVMVGDVVRLSSN